MTYFDLRVDQEGTEESTSTYCTKEKKVGSINWHN